MLALTRRLHESVIIDESIELKIVAIRHREADLQITGAAVELDCPVTLKLGQRISIGPDMHISVYQLFLRKVSLAFDMPREIRIRRKELSARPVPPLKKSCAESPQSSFLGARST